MHSLKFHRQRSTGLSTLHVYIFGAAGTSLLFGERLAYEMSQIITPVQNSFVHICLRQTEVAMVTIFVTFYDKILASDVQGWATICLDIAIDSRCIFTVESSSERISKIGQYYFDVIKTKTWWIIFWNHRCTPYTSTVGLVLLQHCGVKA